MCLNCYRLILIFHSDRKSPTVYSIKRLSLSDTYKVSKILLHITKRGRHIFMMPPSLYKSNKLFLESISVRFLYFGKRTEIPYESIDIIGIRRIISLKVLDITSQSQFFIFDSL